MPSTEMGYLEENKWHHFTVDLSAYAGKAIFVALRHTTSSANALAFFDDFTFTHVSDDMTGIESVKSSLGENAQVEVYSVNGVLVAKGIAGKTLQNLKSGMYVVKTSDGQVVKTIRK
jgi:translation elongation factor P/translation initiation factor 5A